MRAPIASGRSSADRTYRNLAKLEGSASTARTLNLISIWNKNQHDQDYKARPLFSHPVLNRSIIVKHRLRQDERDIFHDARNAGTKVILPIDNSNLRLGARSFFIDQRGYGSALDELYSGVEEIRDRDEDLLRLLDEMPSLDPFLMREQLKRSGFDPARCYFDISDADTARMFEFVRREVSPLVGLSFENVDAYVHERTSTLARKIIANAGDEELRPLREGLGLDRASFEEGVFCWKGFIYYKWILMDVIPRMKMVASEIAAVRASGRAGSEELTFIQNSRSRLARALGQACETVRMTLAVYDDAYADLTRNGQPMAFREFLLQAPSMFHELGERLGAVQHIVSFWRYRFPIGGLARIGGEELAEILADFEISLSFEAQSQSLQAARR